MKRRHVGIKSRLIRGKYFNHGLTRLEVLISLFVLFTGLLGAAALQKTEGTSHWKSHERAEAVLQAYDIIDRMRANPIGKMHGDYNNISLGEIPTSRPDCAITACTPDQRATYDISRWGATNGALLANGRGAVCHGTFGPNYTSCSPAGSAFSVAITWTDGNEPQSIVVRVPH
jgi:type IV pilus assembly protein PilV